ncbi:PEP/pyruvate-binding domain-containing protein [Gynuella sunshinyii]|uniref:Phosphoenolpyruvate synthase/pyruvate phosphate dikinase n=1 Tax=Gynuella sunshinyii YC6258 TaxID=1445510 RepID=A0A0C5VCW8_9GAMM|nr:PEP/pyruvate-binding domain-containing protein [Gynuella sunshinyii]AJQ97180.1 phosphoenolpyruvate synthase/pyruvate phosphate dikinase [Gynuella sunshinyii YC6258]
MSDTTHFPLVIHWNQPLPDSAGSPLLLRKNLGGKGAALWDLLNVMCMPVPQFCCITASAFTATLEHNNLHALIDWLDHPTQPLPMSEQNIRSRILNCDIPGTIISEITTFLQQYPDNYFAVRSSGTVEDGTEASFAGLFQSILNVRHLPDVLDAVKNCWCSLFNERVQTYMSKQRTSVPLGLALVLQRLVPAEKSGVLFTVDPVRGADTEILIEATFGLGEALVSGAVTPDLYRYDWYRESECERVIAEKEYQCVRIDSAPFIQLEPIDAQQATQPVLSTQEVSELARLGLSIQTQTGFPVDIEWALVNNEFFILQSRPITQFGYAAIPGEWTTADYRDGGVSSSICTPYMASLYKYVIDSTMGAYLQRLHLAEKTVNVWQRSFFGRPYWNLGEVKKCLAKIPGFNERVFDEGLGITPRYKGDGMVTRTTLKTLVNGIRTLTTINASVKRKLRESPQFAKQQRARLQQLAATDFSAMPDADLFSCYETFIQQEYFVSESTYFDFIYDNTNLNGLFKDEVEKTSFDMSQFPLLLSGLSGVSHMTPIEHLWKLRDQILAQKDTRNYWLDSSITKIVEDLNDNRQEYHLDDVRRYLDTFGHHSRQELDLLVPRYVENPTYVIEQLKEVLLQSTDKDPRSRNDAQQSKNQAVKEALIQAAPLLKRRSFKRKLDQVREFLWWREELRDLSVQFYLYVRKITVEVEKRLLKTGILQQPNDVFFLEMADLIAIVRGNMKAEEARKAVIRNRHYYLSFAHYDIADEVGERHGSFAGISTLQDHQYDTNAIKGVAGSPGTVTGIARVIADIDDADRLQPEDILVTRCTDPGWTPKFSMLSGVVTETGGILSHAAVICREYGIPAVLAVKHATRTIKDGETITIDGSHGRVILADPSSQENSSASRTAETEATV